MTMINSETLEHLDFDFEIPCESYRIRKGGEVRPDHLNEEPPPAVWRVARACCVEQRGLFGFFCDGCMQGKLDSGYVTCPVCMTRYAPATRAWILMERFK